MDEQSYISDFHIAELIERYISGQLQPGGQVELDTWLNRSESNRKLFDRLTDQQYQRRALAERQAIALDAPLARIKSKIAKRQNHSRQIWIYRVAVAAALLSIASIGAIYLLTRQHTHSDPGMRNEMAAALKIPPGQPSARLLLSGGRSIALNNRTDTSLGAVQVKNGAVSYNGNTASEEVNTLVTPNGGTYKLVLEDGTKVWLNAASVLKFPTRFSGRERSVELNGEGYFEIAPNAQRPFIVISNHTAVHVLGTAFDIQSYRSNVVKTTLVSGKVKVVSQSGNNKLVSPGQMAVAMPSGIDLRAADTEQVIAWKNDRFIHRDASLEEVMEEIARWYNVEVSYEGNYKEQEGITIEISRQVSLGEVLEMLKASGAASFKVDGRKITVVAN